MAKTKSNVELTRVNLNLPKQLVEGVKIFAKEIGLPVTSAYIILLKSGLNKSIDELGLVDAGQLEDTLIDLVCNRIITSPKVIDKITEMLKP